MVGTQAAINRTTELEIMRQTGHRSLATLGRYIREGQLFRAGAAGKLGLDDVTWRRIFPFAFAQWAVHQQSLIDNACSGAVGLSIR
jgi:hypothetical protein